MDRVERDDNQQSQGPSGERGVESDVLGLAELASTAGVSPRTIRYYIAEGLLPPPVGAGPRSAYTPAHLDRLRLIGRLKDAYLPLKEIRRQLAGLDDAAVRRALGLQDEALGAAAQPATAAPPPALGPLDSAAAYAARVLHAQGGPGLRAQAGGAVPGHGIPPAMPGRGTGILHERHPPVLRVAEPAAAEEADAGAWRRISLGDDAELLIRDDAYHRKRERVEWLIRWARRVFA